MTFYRCLPAAGALLMLGFVGSAAFADQTGMASMHDQRRVGGRLCFTDHTHTGSSTGASSKAAALKQAIDSWRSFTAFEYGTDWASFSRAIGKATSCSQSGGRWDCSVEGRPCR